jgi:hypothetical protein
MSRSLLDIGDRAVRTRWSGPPASDIFTPHDNTCQVLLIGYSWTVFNPI